MKKYYKTVKVSQYGKSNNISLILVYNTVSKVFFENQKFDNKEQEIK